ncbi:DUF2267 domain-containing protein [Deltaproteobacteria bacterium PRO3]|nr:DUF2267 domain-containing protein [Deltaproteobacteria bacterium PRO3]
MAMHVSAFEKTIEKSNAWIKELMQDLQWSDPQRGYRALRVVLHALRDHLPLGETVQLGAQLPMLLRGLYYEGWRPADRLAKERHEADFLLRVAEYFDNDTELETVGDLSRMVSAVFRVLSRHVSRGEIADIVHLLPRELREYWA